MCAVTHPFVAKIRADLVKPANVNKFTPKKKSHDWTRDRSEDVETFPPQLQEEEYDPTDDFVKDIIEENQALKDRVGINAMDASEEEKAMAKETIDSLREENRLLTIERNGLKISRDNFQRTASEAIKQCSSLQFVIKKLNKQIAELQAKSNCHTPNEEPLPF